MFSKSRRIPTRRRTAVAAARARNGRRRGVFAHFLPWVILVGVAAAVYAGLAFLTGSPAPVEAPEAAAPQAELRVEAGSIGAVEVKFAGAETWNAAAEKMPLEVGDRVRTGSGAAEIVFFDESVVRLAAGTEFAIGEISDENGVSKISGFLDAGRIWARVVKILTPDSSFEIETRTVVAAVRGTAFEVEAGDAGTTVRTAESTVAVSAVTREAGVRKTLATTEVPEGFSTEVAPEDLEIFEKKTAKLDLRTVPIEVRTGDFWRENELRDAIHLNTVREKLEQKVEAAGKSGLLRRAFDADLRASQRRDRELLLRLRAQTKAMPAPEKAAAELREIRGEPENPPAENVENPDEKIVENSVENPEPDSAKKSPAAGVAEERFYTVGPGDTLSGIAARLGIGWLELARENNLSEPYDLAVGDRLLLPRGVANPAKKIVENSESILAPFPKTPVQKSPTEAAPEILEKEPFDSDQVGL